MATTVAYVAGRRIAVAGAPAGLSRAKVSEVASEDVWDAFTANEQETLATHTNARVQVFMTTLKIRQSVPKGKVLAALNALESAGILAAGRANEIVNALR